VTRWFSKHLPHLAGAVIAVLVNPVIGAVVAAGDDGLIGELRRRVGIDPS
jgi:tetrahydromethanopterin S-methyltransferase subunit C